MGVLICLPLMQWFAGTTIASKGGVPEESTAAIMAPAGTGGNGSDFSLSLNATVQEKKGDGLQVGGIETEYWDRNITIDVESWNEHMQYTKYNPQLPQEPPFH